MSKAERFSCPSPERLLGGREHRVGQFEVAALLTFFSIGVCGTTSRPESDWISMDRQILVQISLLHRVLERPSFSAIHKSPSPSSPLPCSCFRIACMSSYIWPNCWSVMTGQHILKPFVQFMVTHHSFCRSFPCPSSLQSTDHPQCSAHTSATPSRIQSGEFASVS